MQSYGSSTFSLQNRYSAVSPETISIHRKLWNAHRRHLAYACFLLLALIVSGSVPGQIAVAAGTLSLSPTSVSFGSVATGSSKSVSVTIKNTGTSSLSISAQALRAPASFSVSGMTIPKTLAAGASVVVSVRFAPTTTGSVSGYVTYLSNATNSTAQLSLSGTGVIASVASVGTVAMTPSSVSFGTVAIGTTNSQTVQLKNTGSKSLTISSAFASGVGYRMTGIPVPLTLAASQAVNFTVTFTPKTSGTLTGSVTVESNASNPAYTLQLSGAGGSASRTISLSTSSLNFGNETVGDSSSLGVLVKNTGNSSLTISQVGITGAGFGIGGGFIGATIAAGQTAQLNVVFAPKTTGSVTGKITITSNATNSPNSVSASGTGVSSTAHSVALSWTSSASSGVTGYYVYRSTTSGSSYSRVNSTPTTATRYTDGSVAAGETYYYVVTAVTSTGAESVYSAQVTANVP
jgi:hypothetical protein